MQTENQLRRQVGLAGAIMMGLGSIVGTGVFVSNRHRLHHAAGIALFYSEPLPVLNIFSYPLLTIMGDK